jgi:nucleoside-diphosphate-sugar epimerase
MNIVITGINGFVGHYLEKKLISLGHNVIGIDKDSKNSNTFAIDITEKDHVRYPIEQVKPDVIYHLAAVSRVDYENPDILYNINVNGTINVLSALMTLKIKPKFVFISSSQVYGRIDTADAVDETYRISPVNHYGASKASGEAIVMAFAEDYNIPYTIARPFNHTGPGQTDGFVIAKIVSAFKRREPVIELGNIDVYRDYLDVRDVIDAYMIMLSDITNSNIYNIASGEPVKIADVLTMLTNLTGHSIEIKTNDKFIRSNEIERVTGSAEKIKSVGWQKNISFYQTLHDMVYC